MLELSKDLILGVFDFAKGVIFRGDKFGLNPAGDSLGIIDFAKSAICIFVEVILFGFIESGLIDGI